MGDHLSRSEGDEEASDERADGGNSIADGTIAIVVAVVRAGRLRARHG